MASLRHKQAGRKAAATREERMEEVLPSCIPVVSYFRPWRS